MGIAISQAIQGKNILDVEVRWGKRDGPALMDLWKDFDSVIAIDAVSSSSGAQAGRLYRFEAHGEPIPTAFSHCSTHAFGLPEAIELARSLNQLPARFIVYGIEGKEFMEKVGLSQEVTQAAAEVEQRVLRDIQSIQMMSCRG